jgi:hypothetical protein
LNSKQSKGGRKPAFVVFGVVFHLLSSKISPIFVPSIYHFIFMKRTKNKADKEGNEIVPEEKKSKITLYWEDRRRRGIPPGEILNMRAILK